MAVVYYDNLEASPADDAPGHVEVERIYCFDWDRFHNSHWQSLAQIYDLLPGVASYPDGGVPWWFGHDVNSPPFLWASVEPSGLQVYDVLAIAEWVAWDSLFRVVAGELPMRVLQ